MSATEFYTNTPLLQTLLWIEAVIYLGIGLFEMFDDFLEKPASWMTINGRVNAFLLLTHKVGHKMHAGICVLLGFVALNGALEGQVTRFELELVFLSFALLMPVIWATVLPGRLGIVVVVLKPEFWLQILMFSFFSHLVRPEILGVCIVFNLWGLAVYFLRTRRTYVVPYTYQELRDHLVDADTPALERMDRLAGYTPRPPSGQPTQ